MPKKSLAFTAKSWLFGKAPNLIQLLGDRAKPESAQHIIEFPGGAVEVSRTTDGLYWAHIIVNRGWAIDDIDGLHNCKGVVLDSRVDNGKEIVQLPQNEEISQIAVLIGKE